MMTTPLLMKLVDKWLSRQFNGPEEEDEKPWVNDDKPQVIVVGFGRFGQVIGRLLMANKMRITVLERDISAVNLMRKYGYKVYYGDATQVDLLRSAGAEAAESIVITCNEPEDTMKLVEICQQHFPHLHILARARGRVEAHELLQAGVTQFSRETFSSALELGRKTLVTLGMHPHQAQRAQLHFRRLDMRMLRELIPMHADTVQISRAREARRELEEIFQREMQQERRQLDGWDEFEKMAIRKRFIAGAKCPACQAQDSMAMWRENNIDIVECVKCGHQMREADKEARDHVRKDEQVIGIFHPD